MAARARKAIQLDLCDHERRALKALMYGILDQVEVEKRSFRIHCPSDPHHGRLIDDGDDITDRIYATEAAARAFLRRLG